MIIVNFSHPLTQPQCARIAQLAGMSEETLRLIEVPVHFDETRPFAEQIMATVAHAGLSPTEWQREQILLVPPSFAPIVAALLAYIHGIAGYFPAAVRLRPVRGSVPPSFEVAELLDLNGLREAARSQRWEVQ